MNESAAVLLREYWHIAIRRKWVIMGAILLSLVVAGILCKVLPKSYRSDTLILVEDQKIPESYVQGIVERNIHQRVYLIQQQIMSRTLLGHVVREFNLYPDLVSDQGIDLAIDKVRRGLKIEMVDSAAQGRLIKGRPNLLSADAFTVSFSDEDPVIAMRVTSAIASKFIEENLRLREQTAAGTTEFLDYEALRAQRELEKKEEEIKSFKSGHLGELPEQMEANLRALDRLQGELHTVSEAIQRQSDRLSMVEKAIAEYELTGVQNPSLGGLVAGHSGPDPLFQRLQELKKDLAFLSAEYKESYPDLILRRKEIKQTEQKLVELYGPEALKQGAVSVDPYLRELKKQRGELKSEIALLRQRQRLLAAQHKDYEQRVERAPTVEQELLIRLRDYDNMMSNYRSLLDKRLNARVAENLEKREKGGQFRIIDPANMPNTPEKPEQLKIMVFGLVFGCGAGFGLAFMLEMFNPTFRRPEDFESHLGTRVLAAIPDFTFVYGQSAGEMFLPVSQETSVEARKATGALKALAIHRWRPLANGGNGRPLEMNLVAKWRPASIVAEQYRVIASQLAKFGAGRGSIIVAVTSAVKGEGKTTTTVNLGYTLARDLGKRTLLVDCDFKYPVLHQYAQTASEPGLVNLLNGDVPVEQCLSSFADIPCWIMPAGVQCTQGNDLLKTQRLATIFSDLRQRFDYIIINTPPVLPLADMNVLAGLADLLFLVVRAGSTPQEVVKKALDALGVAAPVHIILNAVEIRSLPYYIHDYHGSSSDGQQV
jgi:succinoglycan biosynthesis transport protein ExoP